jgi:hypothetical protein
MNNVLSFDPQGKQEQLRKESLLEVIEEIKKQIEDGSIKELVACTMDKDGVAQIHVSALDLPGAVGLFEIGKHMLIQQEA